MTPVKYAETSSVWLQENASQQLDLLRRAVAAHTPEATTVALSLLDPEGRIISWAPSAEQLYGFPEAQALGQPDSFHHPSEVGVATRIAEQLERAAYQGHYCGEGWQIRRDQSRFWANVVTLALRDELSVLHGFAIAVRDFSLPNGLDSSLRDQNNRPLALPRQVQAVDMAVGEFNQVLEANEALVDLLGYSRDDIVSNHPPWATLTPSEYEPLDRLAHEETLRFGVCTPYEKEIVAQDGTRVPVLLVTAVTRLAPLRWSTLLQDVRTRNQAESLAESKPAEPAHEFMEMVGNSAALKRTFQQAQVVAPTDANVLILGETGTGKELIARAIHRLSPRRDLPFVTLNCAAIPTGLLESELFGYERGAFTGALQQKLGRFERAHRGTLFLDEVGDIPLELQPKLLRALQEKSFERLGGTKTIPIDVRLVAATNRNLTEMMGDKLFRSDLYYRLRVFPITMPPLRERAEDIPLLARFFTKKYSAQMGRTIVKIPTDTMNALAAWPWPGNIRERENFIERSVILSRGPSLRAPLKELQSTGSGRLGSATLEEVERQHIIRVLRESGGVVTKAATTLGLHRTTLNAMMRKLGVSRHDL